MKRYGALISVLAFGVLLSLHGQAASAGTKPATVTATPIMGWDGWNEYSHAVTQQTVGNNAWRLVHSGLAADGFTYVIVDAGWAANERSSTGELVANPARYPNGIKALASYVHKLGLKFGIYEPAGVSNCDGSMPGGYSGDVSHYQEDAAQFAAWGVDFIKLDWCGMDPSLYDLPQFKGMSKSQVAETLTKEMSAAISDSGRAMVLDVNDGAGITSHGYDWQWGSSAGAGMWRIACDIKPNYADIVRQIFGDSTECGHSGAVYLGGYAGPGKGWNDPDMLEVGNGPVTHALAKVQLSLWAEEAAPLIMGHNLASFGAHSGSSPASIASMSSTDFSSVSDSHMIAVDQDPLGIAGHIVYGKTTHHWVLTRPLTGGRVAVVLFNGTYRSATLASPTSLLGLSGSGRYIIYNVWGHKTTYLYRNLSARVNPYSADLLVIGR